MNFRPDGTYLITGGLGDLGLEIARWIVERGARYLVLIGRRGPSDTAMEAISSLKKAGSQVVVARTDITDQERLSEVFEEIRVSMPPLRGIFHLAGVFEHGVLLQQTFEDLARVMAPKMEGAWNMHLLTRHVPLDFFVLFSTTSSLWGIQETGSYTAANTFLDALAHHRWAQGLPALSINWGTWSEVGAAVRYNLGDRLAMQGFGSIAPQQALALFGRVLQHNAAQIGVMAVDWPKFLGRFPAGSIPPFFFELARKIRPRGSDKSSSAKSVQLLRQLREASPGQRQELLEHYLKQKIAQVLNLDIDQVTEDRDLVQLGMDSLIFLDLTQILGKELQIKIVLHKVFENSTVRALAKRFANDILSEKAVADSDVDIALSFTVVHDPDKRHLPFDLTDIQQAYWVGRSGALELGNIACHVYIEVDTEDLDLDCYTQAWQRLIERHDMLRAVVLSNGQQQILEHVPPYQIKVLDVTEEKPDVVESRLKEVRQRMSHQVLKTDQWPLFEIRASRLADKHIRLHISLDLLIADVYGIRLMMQELLQLYRNPDTTLVPLELCFRDYVLAEAAFRESNLYQRSREYWINRLPTLPPAPELPLAKNPGDIIQPRFVRRTSKLEPETWLRLKNRASRAGLTPSGILLAAYAEVLSVWSKSARFTINMTLFNRLPVHPQVNNIVGDFTSAILLEVDNSGEDLFEIRALRIQRQFWEDIDHRYFSGVRVLRELARGRKGASGAIMPVVFTSNLVYGDINQDDSAFVVPGDIVYTITQTPQVWIDHQVMEQDGALIFIWDAVEELFPEGLLDDMFEAYCCLLNRLADEEEAWQETTRQLIPAAQLEKRAEANATNAPISPEMLHTLFTAQVPQRLKQQAVVCSNHTLSYEELYNRSNQVGRLLRERGAQPNTLVAVVMDKGWEQVVVVLGILRSGAAYLPIDPTVPKERLWHLLEDGEVSLVLTQSRLDEKLDWPESVQRFSVDTMDLANKDVRPLDPVQGPEDLAYVIYTSGSTGLPKGVMIHHRGAVNTILDINRRFGISFEDRVLALSNLNFDLSVYDIFGTLAAGGTIVLPDASGTKDPAHWLELMTQENVTVWNSVPALMHMFVEYASGRTEVVPQCLRLVLLSGDWIPLDLPDRIRTLVKDVRVISLGGATEASIWSNLYPIEEVHSDWKSIPYGRPMVNQRFYVLNELMEDCPDWVPGQLYIGGIGLAKGYWRDEEKTIGSFIIHPRTGERLYRTGDFGRYLPDGNIEFLGREDFQVKISGYRIELGEIESALIQHAGVREAAVVAIGEPRGDKRLVSYLVFDGGISDDTDELRRFLEGKLPEYMMPSSFITLDAMPLTPNGKIDRAALIARAQEVQIEPKQHFVAPRNFLEKTIAGTWADLLQREQIGIHDNFFELGGSSLLAARLFARLRESFEKEISLVTVFEYPTVSALAQYLGREESQASVGRLGTERGRKRREAGFARTTS